MAKRVVFETEQLQTLVRRYENGAGLRELALEVGCSVPTIRRNLAKAGAVIRGQGRIKGTVMKNPTPTVTPEVEEKEVTTINADSEAVDNPVTPLPDFGNRGW